MAKPSVNVMNPLRRALFSTFSTLGVLLLTAIMGPASALAQGAEGAENAGPNTQQDTPSGLPVPRFVSLKSDRTNCRVGPSLAHAKQVTFHKKGLPVRVIAETRDHWRRIEDHSGEVCWVHARLLSGSKMALIRTQQTSLFARKSQAARVRATINENVIVHIRKCDENFCLVRAGKVAGWIAKPALWGPIS